MFVSIGEIANKGPRRTHEPVRKHSNPAGRCEGVFWRRTSRQEARQIVLAARRYEVTGKAAGSRNGPLGGVALEVLDYLANRIDYRTGRLEPSLDTMMRVLRRSRDAIVRALKALRAHGFVDWLRRYVPTGNESGPQVQQTSNAYRLSLPARALRLLGRFGQPAPLPDDYSHRQEIEAAEIEAHKATLASDELALFVVGDNPLGQALAALGRSIKKRESAKRSESEPRFISKGE
jgi:hypothetical protein